MGIVIEIRDQEKWSEATLARKQLAWARDKQSKMRNDPRFDFDESIAKEENIIRSFFKQIEDQAA